MTGKEAGKFIMPWGKFKGKELDSIPCTYLDWLSGCELGKFPELKEAVAVYVTRPWFTRELAFDKSNKRG